MDMDVVLRKLCKGNWPGRYQIFIYVCLCCNNVITSLNHLSMAIFGAQTPHQCKLPEGHYPNQSLPASSSNGNLQFSQCSVYENYSAYTNRTETCPDGWEFFPKTDKERTVNMEFELVCANAYLKNLSTTIYFCGVMIGGLIFGALSDRLGRKPFLLAALYSQLIVGTGIAFSNSYILFTLLRFVQGILMQGLQTCSFVMISEMFPLEHRSAAGTVFEVFWGLAVIWLAGISYFLENWRHIQLVMTIPSVLTLSYIWLIPESIRWLIIKGRVHDAEKVLEMLARRNGITLPEDPLSRKCNRLLIVSPTDDDLQRKQNSMIIEDTDDEKLNAATAANTDDVVENGVVEGKATEDNPRKYTIVDMCRTPKLRKRSVALCYIWCVTACGYYGLSFQLTSIASNKYLALFLAGVCELPAYCSAVFIIKRFGRRLPLGIYLAFAGLSCVISSLIPVISGGKLGWLSTAISVVGRFSMAGCFSILFLYTSEVFPTVIRNVSMGACGFWTRVGGVIAPQILLLGRLTVDPIPMVIFGTLSLVGVIFSRLLPETKDIKLPDTISEAESLKYPASDSASQYPNDIYRPKEGGKKPAVEPVRVSNTESLSKEYSTTGISSMKENLSVDV